MGLAAFASLALIHLLAAISPGPSFVVMTRTAIADGLWHAILLAVAFGLGAMIWAAAALLGLATLFEIAPVLLTTVKLAGAAFLLFVAFMMWRRAADPLPDCTRAEAPRFWTTFKVGLFTQLSNPKVPVFFGAVFVGILPTDITPMEIALVLLSVFVVEGGWYIIVARLFSLEQPRALYVRMKATVDRTLGIALAVVGGRIAFS